MNVMESSLKYLDDLRLVLLLCIILTYSGFSLFPPNTNFALMFFCPMLNDCNTIQILTSCTLAVADSPLFTVQISFSLAL